MRVGECSVMDFFARPPPNASLLLGFAQGG